MTAPATTAAGRGWQMLGRCGPATAELFFAPDHREPPAARATRVLGDSLVGAVESLERH